MGRDNSPPSHKKSGTRGESPAAIRAQVDRIDRNILGLLATRGKLSALLAKTPGAQAEFDRVTTNAGELVAALPESLRGPLDQATVKAVFREIVSGCRALVHSTRVAFLGPEYSYSHLAAIEKFGTSIEQLPVASIAAVFEEVNRGHAAFGLVPIENSTDGRIADTLDMFTKLRVKICGEVPIRIHHYLLGKCPRAEVSEVYSRPQALSQCRHWLAKHVPWARPIEVISSSDAARLARDKQGAAAIASSQAAAHYGLDVLAEKIEDNQANVTRFAVISSESAARTGKDRTAAMFEIAHRPGSLADSMNIFKRNRLNLTWIESFPIPRPEGGYLFFIELDGHENDLRVRKAFDALAKRSVRFEILGSFPRSEPLD